MTEVKEQEQTEQRVRTLLQAELTSYSNNQIEVVLNLLADGNTVPFIARYRKEATNSLDEVQIREIEERNQYLTNLEKRKVEVLHSIEEQGELTEELAAEIKKATQLQRLEDLYLPYRKKRRTLATIAKEKGLEPLAEWLLTFPEGSIEEEATKYINPEEELETVEDVLAGAHEILAEKTSDNAEFRKWIRHFTMNNGKIEVVAKDKQADEKGVFQMYYEYDKTLKSLASHQVLAINRGEKEGILTVKVVIDET